MLNPYMENELSLGLKLGFVVLITTMILFCSALYFSPAKCGHHQHGSEEKEQCIKKG